MRKSQMRQLTTYKNDVANGEIFVLGLTNDSPFRVDALYKSKSSHASDFTIISTKCEQISSLSVFDFLPNLNQEQIIKRGKEKIQYLRINVLPHKQLLKPIDMIVEPDEDGYIARTVDFPLYGSGDDELEAVVNLKYEIESLFKDLMEDDNFSEEWINYKNFLKEIIAE